MGTRPVSTMMLLTILLTAVVPSLAHSETINVRTDLVDLGIAGRNAAGDGETDDAPVLQAGH